jgi:5'-3' exonuclease
VNARRPNPLLVVDAPSLLFRAFYALPQTITGKGGMPVNALLGSTNIMLAIVAEHQPRAVVMCFGQDAADYRVELFEDYHAERGPIEPEIADQFEQAWDFFEAFGWYCDAEEGYEADDLLGSYALAEQRAGGRTLILTGDRDLYQCVNESCQVLYLKTGTKGAELVDAAGVVGRYGIAPELVPDFIALRGDPSDGIPGAPGIGAKTAAQLLQRHGSLDAAIAAAGGERPRVAAALRENAAALRDFREVAALREIPVRRPRSRRSPLRGGGEAAAELGMRQLADRIGELARLR